MPSSSRDFQKAALQRLGTAEFLLSYDYNCHEPGHFPLGNNADQ